MVPVTKNGPKGAPPHFSIKYIRKSLLNELTIHLSRYFLSLFSKLVRKKQTDFRKLQKKQGKKADVASVRHPNANPDATRPSALVADDDFSRSDWRETVGRYNKGS